MSRKRSAADPYLRNYGTAAEPEWIEMIEVAPSCFVRRDFAEAIGLMARVAKPKLVA